MDLFFLEILEDLANQVHQVFQCFQVFLLAPEVLSYLCPLQILLFPVDHQDQAFLYHQVLQVLLLDLVVQPVP